MDSKQNPLDAVSRGVSAKALLESDWQKRGPGFLWQDESLWPSPWVSQEKMSDDDLGIKRDACIHAVELDVSMETIQKLFCYFSY